MKRFLLLFVVALMTQSCSLEDLKLEIDSIKNRLSTIETSMVQLSDYQKIKDKVNNGKFILSFKQGSDGSYTITFSDNTTITIKDGKDGADGKDGIDGKDGKDGANGKDGIDGIDGKDGKDGADGKDGIDGKDGKDGADGKDGIDGKDGKDGANGKDGKDGIDGVNGTDGITPTFKIENELWYVSYDEGGTWTAVGSAIDRSLFKAVSYNTDYLYLTLADDTILTIPIGERNVFRLVIDETAIVMAADNGSVMKSRRIDVPFTLTGKLDNPRFLFTVDLDDKETPGFYLTASVKWNPEKTGGFIEISQPAISYYYENTRENDIIFPGGTVNILAVNGDGQSSLKSKYVNYERMEIYFDYVADYSMTRTNQNAKYFDIEQSGGNIDIDVYRYVFCKGYPDVSNIVRAAHNSDVFYYGFYEPSQGVIYDATVDNNPYNPSLQLFVDYFCMDYLVYPNTEGIERTVFADLGRLDSATDPSSTINDMSMVLTQDY